MKNIIASATCIFLSYVATGMAVTSQHRSSERLLWIEAFTCFLFLSVYFLVMDAISKSES